MTRAERVEKAARAMLVEFDWLVNIGRIHGYEQTRDALRAALALPVDAPVDAGGAFRDIWQHDETGRIVELPLGSPSPGARYALVATTNAQIGHPTPPAPHVDAGGAVAWRDSFPPTHYCKECRALWRKWPDGSWSLVTMACGKCCDNVPMGEQIVALYAQPAQGAVAWGIFDKHNEMRGIQYDPAEAALVVAESDIHDRKSAPHRVVPLYASPALGERRRELAEALALILPLAKGYAAAHPVGSNGQYVAQAEALLAAERGEAPRG